MKTLIPKRLIRKFLLLFSAMLVVTPAFSEKSALSSQSQVLIFISSSMPQASLVQWLQQAQSTGASLVLRGFVDNSLSATNSWLHSLNAHIEHFDGVEINPVAFESFRIKQVPAVVITTGKLHCFSNDHCQIPAFDVVYGNISLNAALKIIADNGEVTNLLAKQKLAELAGETR